MRAEVQVATPQPEKSVSSAGIRQPGAGAAASSLAQYRSPQDRSVDGIAVERGRLTPSLTEGSFPAKNPAQ